MKESFDDDEISSQTDEFLEDREEQKKLVHPYRKYQLFILLMLILMIILIIILYNKNIKLKEYLEEKDIALTSLTNFEKESKGVKEFYEIVDINYKYLNKLDECPNIDIIRNPEEIFFLSSLLKENSMQTITYEICYKSKEDGDSPQKYIDDCISLSPLIFLIETTEGYRFGVYTSKYLYREKEGYIYDDKAFIFSLDTFKKYDIKKPDYAIYTKPNDFPWFGKNDIYIGKDFTKTASSFCDYPVVYERNPEDIGDYILNGGIKKFIIKEMEILSPSIWL